VLAPSIPGGCTFSSQRKLDSNYASALLVGVKHLDSNHDQIPEITSENNFPEKFKLGKRIYKPKQFIWESLLPYLQNFLGLNNSKIHQQVFQKFIRIRSITKMIKLLNTKKAQTRILMPIQCQKV
jgi:hypothetical protein